jgi:hypothetical protein
MQGKRAIGGAGPDYTFPPIPRTTITSTVTRDVTLVPTVETGQTTVVTITTIVPQPANTVTLTVTFAVPVTTETVRSTQIICPTSR